MSVGKAKGKIVVRVFESDAVVEDTIAPASAGVILDNYDFIFLFASPNFYRPSALFTIANNNPKITPHFAASKNQCHKFESEKIIG